MISAFIETDEYVGPALIYHWSRFQDIPVAICADDEGRGRMIGIEALRFDVRYDWNTHQWVDVNGVTDAEEEPTPDGGEEVP